MWVMIMWTEYGEQTPYGPFNTEEEAVKELEWCRNEIEEACKALGQEYKVTKLHDYDLLIEDDEAHDGNCWLVVRQLLSGGTQIEAVK